MRAPAKTAKIPRVTPSPEPDLPDRLASLPAVSALRRRLAGRDDVWLVGGAIRDLLLGERPHDLDLVVEGELEPVLARFDATVRLHDRFGTATVLLDGARCDLARTRRERYRHPGALPEVEPAPLPDDLRRRDFTVNAIAARLGDGALLAVPNALDDLARGWLRVLHDESFTDDPTRLLRLARYAARLGFSPEPGTARLAAEAVAAGALNTVAGQRIRAELALLAAEPDPVAALGQLRQLGIDEAVAHGFGLRNGDSARRLSAALNLLPGDGDRVVLVLAAALRDVAPGERRGLLDRLGLPAAPRDAILAAVDAAPGLRDRLRAATRPSQVAAAVGHLSPEAVVLAAAGDPDLEATARTWLSTLRHVALEIRGDDLLAAGLAPGPQIGRALARARAARLDGVARDRAEELAAALRDDGPPADGGTPESDGTPG